MGDTGGLRRCPYCSSEDIIGHGVISVNLSQIATEHVVFREGVNTTLSCIVINI